MFKFSEISHSYRGIYPPAEEYLSHAEKPNATLVEVFKAMQIAEEDLPVENGDPGHEVLNFAKKEKMHDT